MALSWPSKREGKSPLAREKGEGPKGGERGAENSSKMRERERESRVFARRGALIDFAPFGGWPKPLVTWPRPLWTLLACACMLACIILCLLHRIGMHGCMTPYFGIPMP